VSTSTDGIMAYGVDLSEVDWEELGYVSEGGCEECTDEVYCGQCFEDEGTLVASRLAAAGIKGVGLTRYQTASEPLWLLTSRTLSVRRGDVVRIDRAYMNVPAIETLAIGEAARALGLLPDCSPAWLLVSYWDR
jgi:hypothetical protein